jgi:dienelactone hydrolase
MRDQFKVNVLAVEYPGYGLLSQLKPSDEAVCEVALTAFRFLFDEVKVRYSQIVLFGRSLGSGPAVHLASQYPVGGLILVSAFSSIRGVVQSIAGGFLAWGVKEHFPNLQLISNVSCSTLIIHGESDGLIPVEHSLRLFKRCRARKLLITPPTMDHNSNLFCEASYLAVPAIHFFGFPGFCTAHPPKMPSHLFEKAEKSSLSMPQEDPIMRSHGLCGCLARKDPHHLDVSLGNDDHVPADITIRFHDSVNDKNNGGSKHDGPANPPMHPAVVQDSEINAECLDEYRDQVDKASMSLELSKENIRMNQTVKRRTIKEI